jgi:ABC-type amino acid transport substrate-binding protein
MSSALQRIRLGLAGWLPAAGLLALLAAAPAVATAGPVLDRIQATGTLKVCIWPEYYGVTWRNPRTQRLGGIDIELSAALAVDMNV